MGYTRGVTSVQPTRSERREKKRNKKRYGHKSISRRLFLWQRMFWKRARGGKDR